MSSENIIAQITEIAPKLTESDVKDLLGLDYKQQQEILADYQAAKKLNKPQVKKIIDYLVGLKPLIDLISSLSQIL